MRPALSLHLPAASGQYRPQLGWVVGLALVAIWWPVSWLQVKPFSEYAFFPLWLGYILVVDTLVFQRRGTSLMTRSPRAFLGMFIVSVPLWWTFEAANEFTENWYYLGAEDYSTLRYVLLASWHFSIVVPAVFEMAELVGSFAFVWRFQRGPRLPASGLVPLGAILLGLLLGAALVFWPTYAFPGAWLFLFLVLDPINYLSGRPSVLMWLRQGDWRLVMALGMGALVCGWFWEMWNYWAFPKWQYDISFLGFARVFEMPLLGYGGYIPFGLEVYALYHFVMGIVGIVPRVYLHLADGKHAPQQTAPAPIEVHP